MTALPQRPPQRGAMAPPSNDPPAPMLPPRPGGRGSAVRPPPAQQPEESDSDGESNYTDPEKECFYDDFEVDEENNKPPPLPERPTLDEDSSGEIYDDCSEKDETEQLVYDDVEEQRNAVPKLPARPLPPAPAAPEVSYDDITSDGPVVQHIKKPQPNRGLPPTPGERAAAPFPPPPTSKVETFEDVYEDPDKSQQLPRDPENEYEVDQDDNTLPPPLPSPPNLPPKDLPKQPKPAPQPRPSPGLGTGGPQGFSLNLNELKDKRQGLRKVSTDSEHPTVTRDPKVYGEPGGISNIMKKFQEKEKVGGKPGVSPKPALMPKINPNHVNTSSPAPKTPPSIGKKGDSSDAAKAPDVTFISKNNKEKVLSTEHTNVPLPPSSAPATSPSKPIKKFEPPPPAEVPDDIYDDATSADVLERFDWFHGDLTRSEGESRVKAVGKDGAYLVRVSKKDMKYPYTLVVLHHGHVNNLRIRKRADGKVALGDDKPDELAFGDVTAMINHHKSHNVVLLGNNQAHVMLQHPAYKK